MKKESKRLGRKPLDKNGVAMTERVSMGCTKEEADILRQATILSERENIAAFLRSVIVPIARDIVTNKNLYDVSVMLKDPEKLSSVLTPAILSSMQNEMLLHGNEILKSAVESLSDSEGEKRK